MIPIVNLPSVYHNGCELAWGSNTTLTVATGQVRDSTNTYDIVVEDAITIDAATNGANGLDTGDLAASTGYYVFVIYDPTNANPPAGLISTSATAPVMPSLNGVTYGAFRLVGWALTDGSIHFLKCYADKGNDNTVFMQWDAPITVLNAGSASSADVSLATAMPSSNFGRAVIKATYTPHAAAETASVKPKSATANTYVLNGIVASVAQPDVFEILPSSNSGAPTLTYSLSVTTSPAALSLEVTGFYMNL